MELEVHWAGKREQRIGLGISQAVRRVDEVIYEALNGIADWGRHAEDHGLSKSVSSAVALQHGLTD